MSPGRMYAALGAEPVALTVTMKQTHMMKNPKFIAVVPAVVKGLLQIVLALSLILRLRIKLSSVVGEVVAQVTPIRKSPHRKLEGPAHLWKFLHLEEEYMEAEAERIFATKHLNLGPPNPAGQIRRIYSMIHPSRLLAALVEEADVPLVVFMKEPLEDHQMVEKEVLPLMGKAHPGPMVLVMELVAVGAVIRVILHLQQLIQAVPGIKVQYSTAGGFLNVLLHPGQ